MEEVQPGDPPIEASDVPVLGAASHPDRLNLARLTKAAARGLNLQARPAVLNHRTLEALFRQEPLLQRGIKKHTGDLVKLGFTVIKAGEDDEEHEQNDLVEAWFRDGFIWNTVREALISAHVHGDGFVEIEWDDNGDGADPVQEGAIPVAIHVIDPVNVRFIEDEDDDGEEVAFLVQDQNTGRQVTLHPHRYHHFRFTTLPGHNHGVSTIETAYHAALAKVKGDQAIGEVLYWSGNAKVHASVKDGKQDDLDAIQGLLTDPNFARGFATDDRTTVTQLSPGALNPQPFYEALKESLAAAVGIPVTMLTGVQAGAVTGSETNLTDYHSDLLQGKVNVLEPFVVRIVAPIIGEESTTFDVQWVEPAISADKQAAITREKATAFNLLKDGGFTPEAAARIAGLDFTDEDFKDEPDPLLLPPVMAPPAPGRPAPQQQRQPPPAR